MIECNHQAKFERVKKCFGTSGTHDGLVSRCTSQVYTLALNVCLKKFKQCIRQEDKIKIDIIHSGCILVRICMIFNTFYFVSYIVADNFDWCAYVLRVIFQFHLHPESFSRSDDSLSS